MVHFAVIRFDGASGARQGELICKKIRGEWYPSKLLVRTGQ